MNKSQALQCHNRTTLGHGAARQPLSSLELLRPVTPRGVTPAQLHPSIMGFSLCDLYALNKYVLTFAVGQGQSWALFLSYYKNMFLGKRENCS